MALRVLLADESTTIKKVMQLALQDFAVEVKAVHAGVDVVEVARAFQPDIIFADVLLQKKNGYEVCGDIKNDPGLRSIPVVLMWSSFMDLDEKLALQCGANNRLEKPFDVESLRQLVLQLVPKTQTQRLAHFLSFPGSFADPLKAEEAKKQEAVQPIAAAPLAEQPQAPVVTPPPPAAPIAAPIAMPPPARESTPTSSSAIQMPPPPPVAPPRPPPPAPRAEAVPMPHPPPQAPPPPADSTWSMESFEDIEEFATHSPDDSSSEVTLAAIASEPDPDDAEEGFTEFKLTNLSASRQPAATRLTEQTAQSLFQSGNNEGVADDEDPWSHQDLSRFKLDLPPVSVDTEDFSVDLEVSENELAGTDFLLKTNPHAQHQAMRSNMSTPVAQIAPELESFDSNPKFELDTSAPSHFDEPSPLNEVSLEEVPVEGPDYAYSTATGSRFDVENDSMAFEQEDLTQGSVPRLSAERLEEIVRAQSKEIIESVVRRIVPDIASTLIKQELQRLLEESGSSHDRSERETRR